mmetsp:Transcript_22050/g.48714  ORF Transcript_22050/g.48714 Transcript_22050/m.48714 type:complete len:244 (+) Transcript_22050:272-1003(+)
MPLHANASAIRTAQRTLPVPESPKFLSMAMQRQCMVPERERASKSCFGNAWCPSQRLKTQRGPCSCNARRQSKATFEDDQSSSQSMAFQRESGSGLGLPLLRSRPAERDREHDRSRAPPDHIGSPGDIASMGGEWKPFMAPGIMPPGMPPGIPCPGMPYGIGGPPGIPGGPPGCMPGGGMPGGIPIMPMGCCGTMPAGGPPIGQPPIMFIGGAGCPPKSTRTASATSCGFISGDLMVPCSPRT